MYTLQLFRPISSFQDLSQTEFEVEFVTINRDFLRKVAPWHVPFDASFPWARRTKVEDYFGVM